ncbi:MAG: ABC transporter ATP-binding protein [Chloroflexi bacterium]|nr:ABC transporter ATP-binding protein [Chloroflexota bacterium]
MSSDVMIETKGLTKTYGKLTAVDSLDLSVRRGVIHGFIGPNGAGKSTAIKMLVGAVRCTRGRGIIKGHPMGAVEANGIIGYSPEHPAFYKDMTAWDYLLFMAGLSGMALPEAESRARELLEWLELGGAAERRIGGFSAGMKQRLSLAHAMMHRPELLILDEPTANLDPGGRLALLDKLKALRREQAITIFVSSHILSELEYIVDAVTFVDKGRLVVENSVSQMKQEISLNRYVLSCSNTEAVLKALQGKPCIQEMHLDADGVIHLGSPDMSQLQIAVMEALIQCGAVLKYFGEEQVKLEDIYRSTMGKER